MDWTFGEAVETFLLGLLPDESDGVIDGRACRLIKGYLCKWVQKRFKFAMFWNRGQLEALDRVSVKSRVIKISSN